MPWASVLKKKLLGMQRRQYSDVVVLEADSLHPLPSSVGFHEVVKEEEVLVYSCKNLF